MQETRPAAEPLLRVRGLKKYFSAAAGFALRQKGVVRAVDGLDFHIMPGETLGLVGESGCGKTSTGRCILRLVEPTSGAIEFDGQDITTLNRKAMTPFRRHMQIIFQDPFSSLNPRMTVRAIVSEPFLVHKICRGERLEKEVGSLLDMVGLERASLGKYPHEFSGGQRQRIGIARALALRPRFIVADEPVSALDVSVQAQIINLLVELQEKLGLTLLFISHDLNIVKLISERIAVMYLGKIVELGTSDQVYMHPKHPYTRLLLESIPRLGQRIEPGGREKKHVFFTMEEKLGRCRFADRCPEAFDRCRRDEPALIHLEDGRDAACHLFLKEKKDDGRGSD